MLILARLGMLVVAVDGLLGLMGCGGTGVEVESTNVAGVGMCVGCLASTEPGDV